ncbi:MAG: hypothetical protein ACK5LT_09275 [Lachnospirales bacterium]
MENDVYGLYATNRTLNYTEYKFQDNAKFNEVFKEFDSFMLREDLYISPAYAESNLVDTYYADALLNTLNIKSNSDIGKYCLVNKNNILESDPLNIYYYLQLLQRNDLLRILETEEKKIAKKLQSTLQILINDKENTNINLPEINGCIKSLKILKENIKISNDAFKDILKNFSRNSNLQQEVYDLNKLVEFIFLVSPNNKNTLQEHCKQLEKQLLKLSASNASNKIMLQSMSLDIFKNTNYNISTELQLIVIKTLIQAQDCSGLFKGGDSNEDIINFRNTYDAIILLENLD